MRLSLRSERIALTRAIRPATAEAAGAGAIVSVPVKATGSFPACAGRDAKDGKAIAPQYQ